MCKYIFVAAFLCVVAHADSRAKRELGLLDVLKSAEDFNPSLKSAKYKEDAAAAKVTRQRAQYYPDVSAAAVASTGEPGAFSMFDVDSDISSSQRVGVGGALVLKQDLWDFGRTGNAVDASKAGQVLEQKQTAVTKVDVEISAFRSYLSCAFLRAQVDNARFMADEAQLLARETDRFVRSGQRSIVERYLVDAEAKEAETRIAEFGERLKATQARLALELGKSDPVACMTLNSVMPAIQTLESRSRSNPLVEAQKAKVDVARSRLGQAKAEARPWLYGMATVGYFDNDSLKDKNIYSAGVGIKLPLFEGFRIDAGERESQAELSAEEAGLNTSQLSAERLNSRYDEQIQSLKVRIEFLERERKLAKQVFTLARKRYMNLQGTMVDLREAIRNMNRILISTDETYRDLYLARGERALINGSRLE